jgi:hypothetical protein
MSEQRKAFYAAVGIGVVLLVLGGLLIGVGQQDPMENLMAFATIMLGFATSVLAAAKSVAGITGLTSWSREDAVAAGATGLLGAALIFVGALI